MDSEEKFNKVAEDLLSKLLKEGSFQIRRWEDTKFFEMKAISTTEKGNIAEDLLVSVFSKCFATYRV